MASLVDAPSMAVDPAEPARASTTPPSKSQKKREQRRRAAERKRAAAGVPDAAAALEPAPPGTAPGIAPGTAPGTAPDATPATPRSMAAQEAVAALAAGHATERVCGTAGWRARTVHRGAALTRHRCTQ